MYGIKLKGYEDFRCIADKCTDTCCGGWDILIDKDSLKKYMKDPLFKQSIEKMPVNKESAYRFKLAEDKKCVNLDPNGLCKMVLKRGGDFLCETCQEYPREKILYGGNVFFIQSFSCEAAITHILKNEEPLTFEIEDLVGAANVDDRYFIAKNGFTRETNFEILNVSMAILQNDNYELYEKISYMYMMYKNIDELEKSNVNDINDENVDNILSQYLENLQNTEIFDVIKNVKFNDEVFNKGEVIRFMDKILCSVRELLETNDPELSEKLKNKKNLIDYSNEEIANYNKKVCSFINNNEKMFSKFLILLMVQTVFPTDFKELKDAMTYIFIRIFLIQTTVISLNIENGSEVTEEMFYESLRLITRAFEHSRGHREQLMDFVVEQKIDFKLLMNIIL